MCYKVIYSHTNLNKDRYKYNIIIMGVPQKPKTSKKCAKGKKSCKAGKKSAPMWGGSPASAMLFDDIANPTNPDNYLDADIPLVANQTSAKSPMTGGSLASAAVVGAVNTQREPGAMLNDYESAMDLKGCGSKAVMTGGSIAYNNVMRHVSLPGVLKPDEVTRMVPDYLSLDPAARPVNNQLTGGAIDHQGPLQRQFAMAPVEQHGQVVGPEGQMLIPQPGEEWEGDWNHPPADQPKPKRGSKKVSKRRSTSRTVQPKSKASKRTSKRHIMIGGGDRNNGGGPVQRLYADIRVHRPPRNAAEQQDRINWQLRQQLGNQPVNPNKKNKRVRGSSGRRSSKRKHTMAGGNPRIEFDKVFKRRYGTEGFSREQALDFAKSYFRDKIPADIEELINRKFSRSVNNESNNSPKPTMTGGASGFWSGVAGCGPVNVPNAGNTLSKFFTKSSSCPGPDFYANPPGLGSAGSGYATELPSGAPFPFM